MLTRVQSEVESHGGIVDNYGLEGFLLSSNYEPQPFLSGSGYEHQGAVHTTSPLLHSPSQAAA
jgi:hypothetical protein